MRGLMKSAEEPEIHIRRKRKYKADGPKRKKSKPNFTSLCPTCEVKATLRKKRNEENIMICDSCDLPVPRCEPLFECSRKCERKDLCSACANGQVLRGKKRKKLTVLQKFSKFELSLTVDGAVGGDDLDFIKATIPMHRDLAQRTRLKIKTLCVPKSFTRIKEEKAELVRSILMEYHVRQCKTDPTLSFIESSGWCKLQGWNIPGVEIKGESRSSASDADVEAIQADCINERCFAFQVENGKARILDVQWNDVWPNIRPAHESSDVILYVAPHFAKPKPKPNPSNFLEEESLASLEGCEEAEFCEVCGKDTDADKMLLCDHYSCGVGYHTYCLTPKLLMIPNGDWFCPKHQPLNFECPKCKRNLHCLDSPPASWECCRRGHPRKVGKKYGSNDSCYGCLQCEYYMCESCKNDMEALLPASEDEKDEDAFEPVSSVSPVSSDDEKIVLIKTRKPDIKRPPMKRKREEPQEKAFPPRPPPPRPNPPTMPFVKPKAAKAHPQKPSKPRIVKSIPKPRGTHRMVAVRPKIAPAVRDVRKHPQQRPVRSAELRNERRLKTRAHKIPSRKPNASFRSLNPGLFRNPPPLKHFFKQYPVNTPDIIQNANIENFFSQNPHLRPPEHLPPIPPLPVMKKPKPNHIEHQQMPAAQAAPAPHTELQQQLAALSDLCHGVSSSSSDQNGDTSSSTINSTTRQIDPPRMVPLNITNLITPASDDGDDAQSTVSMSISPVAPNTSPRGIGPQRKPPPRKASERFRDLEQCFNKERKLLKPFTQKPTAAKRQQHRANLVRHGIKLNEESESKETDDVEPGEIKIKKIVRFVLPKLTEEDDPDIPTVELGTMDDYLTPKEERRYLNRLTDVISYRALKEGSHLASSPGFEMATRVDEPFFLWTKNEFFIAGQPSSRVTVQVSIQMSEVNLKCKGTIMAAKQISRPLTSSIVLFPDFQISTKVSVNQQLCFSQYLFKKRKRHMKLDVFIPKDKRNEITEFVRCRPAVKALNFIRSPLDYQVWFVPVRQLQNNFLQCQVYLVEWDFFSKLCDKRYRLSIMRRKLNLVIQIEHFLADITVDPRTEQRRDKKVKPKFDVRLKIKKEHFLPLLEHFDITLISCHQQSMINEVVRQLGLERDQFLDEFHRRLFAGIPKMTGGLYSFAQYFEFYHYRRRRNTVLAIADPLEFVEEERDFIFSRYTPNLMDRLREVQTEFFQDVNSLEAAKETSLADILFKLRNNWD